MARKLAVEKLKLHDYLNWVKIKVAYAIGVTEPVMITMKTETGICIDITNDCRERFKPSNIIKELDLLNMNYYEVAKWGSFGNKFNWDKTDNEKER